MTPFELMGLISTIVLSIPIIIIAAFRLAWYRSFPALLAYYTILFSYNFLLLGYVNAGAEFNYYHLLLNNLLNAPLILFFLTYFCSTPVSRKRMMITLFSFLAFEIIVIASLGMNNRAARIATIPGLALSLSFTLYFFINQVKLAIMYHKGVGKALIVASLFFATMGYGYTFVVLNFVNKAYAKDAQIIFFLISILSGISMSIGLLFEQKRIRQLEELRTTREELKALYGEEEEQKATPFGTVALNFDKEQWN